MLNFVTDGIEINKYKYDAFVTTKSQVVGAVQTVSLKIDAFLQIVFPTEF